MILLKSDFFSESAKKMKIVAIFIGIAAILFSCENQDDESKLADEDTNYFATSDEAVIKAKRDLVQILKKNADFKRKYDLTKLKNSTPGRGIRLSKIDFEKILSYDSIDNFAQIASEEIGLAVPLIYENEIIEIIEVTQNSKGWKVMAIGNSLIKNDLSVLIDRIKLTTAKSVVQYETPNIKAYIYKFIFNEKEAYYAHYNGFDIASKITVGEIYPKLKKDAIEFKEKFGGELSKRNLID